MIHGAEIDTNDAICSVDVVFACHFVAPHYPIPIGVPRYKTANGYCNIGIYEDLYVIVLGSWLFSKPNLRF